MQREALYVVSDHGREQFIWATSAAEARALATRARTAEPKGVANRQTLVKGVAPSRPAERRMWHEAGVER